MIGRRCGITGRRPLVVVHGHRDGNAPGGRAEISRECVARVRAAERAARRYGSDAVLFCGAGAPGQPSEARQMASVWEGPDVRVVLDERSEDTAQNADEAIGWARGLGATELVVVSSWWHVRLLIYYSGRRFRGMTIRHARTRRCRRVARHLWHELRYMPEALRARLAERDGWAGGAPLNGGCQPPIDTGSDEPGYREGFAAEGRAVTTTSGS